jgi:predicted component of type VI protein secretion system
MSVICDSIFWRDWERLGELADDRDAVEQYESRLAVAEDEGGRERGREQTLRFEWEGWGGTSDGSGSGTDPL